MMMVPKPLDAQPIFQWLRNIEDPNVRRDTLTLIDMLRVRRIGDLRRYSKIDLTQEIGVAGQTVDGLEAALQQLEKNATFSPRSYLQIQLEQPAKAQRENRNYQVVDPGEGNYFLVNDVKIEVGKSKRHLARDKVAQIYLRFKAGDEPQEIAQALTISPQTVVAYLEKANVYRSPQSSQVVPPAAAAQHQPATGAPPPSRYREFLAQLS